MRDCCCCCPSEMLMCAADVPLQLPWCAWWGPRCGGLWCKAEPECRSSLVVFLFASCGWELGVQGEPASATATAAAAAAAAACGKDVTHWWAWLSMWPPLLPTMAPCMKSLCTIFTEGSPLYPPDTVVTAVLPGCMPPPLRSEWRIEPGRILLLARYGLVAVAIPQSIGFISQSLFLFSFFKIIISGCILIHSQSNCHRMSDSVARLEGKARNHSTETSKITVVRQLGMLKPFFALRWTEHLSSKLLSVPGAAQCLIHTD